MRPIARFRRCTILAILCSGSALLGCAELSESISDPTVDPNGGFEHRRSGLPTNWIVYSPRTIPHGDYDLVFDAHDRMEGRQSLRFTVRDCSTRGGWHSPGTAKEIEAIPGATYTCSFWIRNEGCTYTVRVGGVDAKTGQYTVVDSSAAARTSTGWQRIEQSFTVPAAYDRVRVELNITSPGNLWIDDVQVVRAATEDADADR